MESRQGRKSSLKLMKQLVLTVIMLMSYSIHPCYCEDQAFSDHGRDALELFELTTVRVNSVSVRKGCIDIAFIVAPDRTRHIGTVGTRIGKNGGMIVAITKDYVVVREVVPDGTDWADREVRLKVENRY